MVKFYFWKMNTDKKFVEKKINLLISEFKHYPEKFLTEEDVRSYLYHLLLSKYNRSENCQDGTQSIPLHTEVRWYGTSGKLRLLSDIVILDVSTLKTSEIGRLRLPTKGFVFSYPKVIIEIKLRRKTRESDTAFLNKIQVDRNRIRNLHVELSRNFTSFLLIFDKKRNLKIRSEEREDHKEYYIYPYQDHKEYRV